MVQLDKISGGLVMLLALWGYYIVAGFPNASKPYVLVVVSGLFVSGLALFVKSIMRQRKFETASIVEQFKNIEWKRICLCMLISLIYVVTLRPIGYLITSVVFMMVLMPVLGTRKPITVVGVSLGVTLGLYYVFQSLLGVPLPVGLLRGIL